MSDTIPNNVTNNDNNASAIPLSETKRRGREWKFKLKKASDLMTMPTPPPSLDGLKHVKFKPDNLTLLVNIGYWYEVDLERCNDSAQLLDWIFQVAGKLDKDKAEILWELLHAFNQVARLVFGNSVQGVLCPFGQGYEVDWKSGERKEAK